MWIGVTRGLAGEKFSTSPRRKGLVKHKIRRDEVRHRAPMMSLKE